jgi:DNA-binding transcriptional LysR family regulator
MQVLIPLVPRFMELHPQLSLDIALTDLVIDLMDERADIAIRWGPLPSSELVARYLGDTALCIVASPEYLARRGTPRKPEDLESHERLDFTYRRRAPDWPLRVDGHIVEFPLRARVRGSDGEALRRLADLDAGRLVKVLEKFNPQDTAPIHAVYLGKAERLPARVRAVLDYLAAELPGDPRFRARRT